MANEDALEPAAPAAQEDVDEAPVEEVTVWAPEAGVVVMKSSTHP